MTQIVKFEDNVEVFGSDEYAFGEVTVDVPLVEILHRAKDSCDGFDLSNHEGWLYMLSAKAGDTGFGWLVDSIQHDGFRSDCAIGFDGWDYINEGHHRLTAAILLGLDRVFVHRYSTANYCSEDYISAHYNANAWPVEVEVFS